MLSRQDVQGVGSVGGGSGNVTRDRDVTATFPAVLHSSTPLYATALTLNYTFRGKLDSTNLLFRFLFILYIFN